MRIPEILLNQWIAKLQDEKLTYRESWRLEDQPPLRCRNSMTDQFHYNFLGLLLRTDVGKSKGKFVEIEFPEVESQFFMPGIKYTPYEEYEPQPRKPLPFTHGIGPKILREKFGFIFGPGEQVDFFLRMQKRMTFAEMAEWLEFYLAGKRNQKPTHSNPLLAF